MVREARLAWGDAEEVVRLCVRDRFDEAEDDGLEEILAVAGRIVPGVEIEEGRPSRRERSRGAGPRRSSERHLAGADYLGEGYLPTKRRAVAKS